MIDIRTGFRIPTLDSDAHQGSPVRMNHGDLDPTPKTSQVTEDLNNARLKLQDFIIL